MLCLAAIAACLGLVLTGCIYFGNIRPIAVFTATPDHGNTPLNVAFDASGSSDTDGLIETYYWNFGDGQTASLTIATTNHVFTVQSVSKVFTVILKVTDNLGGTDTAIGNIAVDP
jgi:PKD repeat protein